MALRTTLRRSWERTRIDTLPSFSVTQQKYNHLSSILDNPLALLSFLTFPGKAFQNLSVSSPAPVTMVSPEGLIARKRTLLEWPVSVAVF